MSDVVLAAIVGSAGALFGSAMTFFMQRSTTNRMIEAEDRRLKARIRSETLVAREEARRARLRLLLAELLRRTEPEHLEVDGLANLIMQTQLTLDVRNKAERDLNGHINYIGHLFEGAMGPLDASTVLGAHAELLEKSREALGLTRIDQRRFD